MLLCSWVYIIEGILSIVCALAVWFGLPNDPSNAYFLNEEEKQMMKIRYAQRRQYMGSEEFSWEEVKLAFLDPKLYLRYEYYAWYAPYDADSIYLSQWLHTILSRYPTVRL